MTDTPGVLDARSPVSVVVPCYNYARYLPDALASILAQTRPPAEVVVVDDGSTDGSAEVAQAYHPDIRVVRQHRRGAGQARNAGIEVATGGVIAFLDADDIWPSDSLMVRLAGLEGSAGAGGAFGQVQNFLCPRADPARLTGLSFPTSAAASRMLGTVLVRRGVFDRVGLFDAGLQVGETIEWMSRLDHAGIAMLRVDAVVLERRIHGANTALGTTAGRGDYLRALQAGLKRRRAG